MVNRALGNEGEETMRAGLAAMAMLMAAGTVAPATVAAGDGRARIELSAREREEIRAGMRAYLESIQGIVEGLARHKMGEVAKSAAKGGERMLADVSLQLVMKLPPDFVMISADTHRKLDELASVARETRTKLAVTEKLAEVLENCTSCHAQYKF